MLSSTIHVDIMETSECAWWREVFVHKSTGWILVGRFCFYCASTGRERRWCVDWLLSDRQIFGFLIRYSLAAYIRVLSGAKVFTGVFENNPHAKNARKDCADACEATPEMTDFRMNYGKVEWTWKCLDFTRGFMDYVKLMDDESSYSWS